MTQEVICEQTIEGKVYWLVKRDDVEVECLHCCFRDDYNLCSAAIECSNHEGSYFVEGEEMKVSPWKWEHNGKVYKLVSDSSGDSNACSKCSFGSEEMAKACDQAGNFCSRIGGWYLIPDNDMQEAVKKKKEEINGVKYDSDKLQYTLIPPLALKELARNLTLGLKKYPERNNWKKVDNAQERYLDALYRHLEAHRAGELFDSDSSVPDMYHLAAVAVNAMFLLEFMLDDKLKSTEVHYDTTTLNKVSELVDEIRDSVHLSNSPYSNNEQIVNPYLDVIQDEIDSLRKESK